MSSMTDDYPSMLWITIPPVLVLSVYLVRKWYLARQLRLYGIGKGAPGFQTNVRRIRVTPEIAARLRRGEEVSPEELASASAEAEAEEAQHGRLQAAEPRTDAQEKQQEPSNEWLPDSLTGPKKRAKGKKR